MEIKIQKILSDYGICSRRAGEELIQQGKITVNGSVAQIGQRADPDKDVICVDGKTLSAKPEDTYILLNKPKGYVVTLNDEKGRRNVTDLLQDLPIRVYPVGRLDINSEGLLILTNDGQFSNMLTHPSKEIEKEYYVWVRGQKLDKSIDRLSLPMMIDNYRIKPAKVRVIEQDEKGAQLSVIIHEGRNRQIRKMCENCGLYVTRLKRIREGSLTLGRLATGQWRYLSPKEIEKLCREAGSPSSK